MSQCRICIGCISWLITSFSRTTSNAADERIPLFLNLKSCHISLPLPDSATMHCTCLIGSASLCVFTPVFPNASQPLRRPELHLFVSFFFFFLNVDAITCFHCLPLDRNKLFETLALPPCLCRVSVTTSVSDTMKNCPIKKSSVDFKPHSFKSYVLWPSNAVQLIFWDLLHKALLY